jgi:WD40 repeat protein
VPVLTASRGYSDKKPETHGCGCPYDPDATGLVPSEKAKDRLQTEIMALSWSALKERALAVGLGKTAIENCGVRTDRFGGVVFQHESDSKEAKRALVEKIMAIELIPSSKTVGKPFEQLPKTWHCLNCGAAQDRFEKEVVDAPVCCASWKGSTKGTNFLAVGDTGGALSIYKLRHNDEEEGNGGQDRPGLLAGIDFSNEASLSSANSRDPLRVELFYRRRAAMDDDWITAVKYLPDQNRLAYSSRDGTLQMFSLTRLEEDVPTLAHTETFGTPSRDGVGIRAFDWSPAQRWFATCGPSRAVLLWSTHDTSKPQKILDGHSAVTIDVKMIDTRQQLISLAVDRVIKVWDMRSLVVSQTLSLDPASLYEQNIPTMVWTDENGGCLVGGCMRLARWDPAVGDTPAAMLLSKAKEVPHSHRSPVISVRYIPGLRQIVSIDKTGRTKIWDAESAEQLFAYNGDHATGVKEGRQPALTAFALDVERRRAISAAEDGTVCVWNPNAGMALNNFLPAPAPRQSHSRTAQAGATNKSLEVRAVAYWPEMQHFIAVGWSRSLLCYSDQPTYGQSVAPNWIGRRHKSDIMCVALYHPFLATGGLDGMLVIWRATSVRELMQSKRLCTVRRTIEYKEYGLPGDQNRGLDQIVPGAASEELSIEAAIFGTLRSHDLREGASSAEKLRYHAKKAAGTNDVLITGHGDGCIRVWDTKVWEVRVWWRATTIDDKIVNGIAPTGLPHSVNHLAMDPHGEVIYSTSAGAITAWSIALLRMPPRRKFSWDRAEGSGRGDEIVPVKLASWQVTTSPLKGIALLDDMPEYLTSADEAGDVVLWTCTGERVGMFGENKAWDLSTRETPEFSVPHGEPKEGTSLKERAAAIMLQLFYKSRLKLMQLQREKRLAEMQQQIEGDASVDGRPATSESPSRPTTAVSFATDSEFTGVHSNESRPVTAGSVESGGFRPGTSGGRSDAVTPVHDPGMTPARLPAAARAEVSVKALPSLSTPVAADNAPPASNKLTPIAPPKSKRPHTSPFPPERRRAQSDTLADHVPDTEASAVLSATSATGLVLKRGRGSLPHMSSNSGRMSPVRAQMPVCQLPAPAYPCQRLAPEQRPLPPVCCSHG